MSNIIAVQDMQVMADALVKSGFYGFKTKDQLFAVMLVAQAENKHPATVVQEFDVIQGRPALKSQALLARFQQAGGKVEWHTMTPQKCSGTFTHAAGGSLTVEWTIEMAKQAGLYRDGSGWSKYPEDMLRARCISRAVRAVYPGCILGHYAVEEVMDFDAKPSKVIDMGAVEEVIAAVKQETAPVSDGLPLYIPDVDEPYSWHADAEEWMQAYGLLVKKISGSKKYTTDQKNIKLLSLQVANDFVTLKFDAKQKITLKAVIANNGADPIAIQQAAFLEE
jgi:hypothetical protein